MTMQVQETPPTDPSDLNHPDRNPGDPSRQPPEHPGRDDRDAGRRGQEPPGQGHPRD
ncbi:hypothetical protein QFW77_07680 [Luteimonas sp. RD2P54]|uniref:Uncharacterized protein n=1 Tax=Luteimonas endophytica TaxID=3042023 RepID=A0ABT6J7R9_9GAMM|nr:hypothetical protein [Luteimonas endophytica]MDH5822872.1 hypothetical protein [Luteimonas endophytica]